MQSQVVLSTLLVGLDTGQSYVELLEELGVVKALRLVGQPLSNLRVLEIENIAKAPVR